MTIERCTVLDRSDLARGFQRVDLTSPTVWRVALCAICADEPVDTRGDLCADCTEPDGDGFQVTFEGEPIDLMPLVPRTV